ncbi:hypothetical protein B7494_g7357 [Chlorociboria aeruginascens]|nr:hypothetical protein B7494_g7357 [Chlorociboria aeruginascens]
MPLVRRVMPVRNIASISRQLPLPLHPDVDDMSLFTAQVDPGRGLDFLRASLHDILTRLKAEPQRFPKLGLIYEPNAPVTVPVIVYLSNNGIRLRFDGPEQRLRLIEVLDFTKNKLTHDSREIFRHGAIETEEGQGPSGPTFKHIYRLLGPTYFGDYIEPEGNDETRMGTYVLSYPGIALTFLLHKSSWSPGKDPVSLLSSSQVATSMAIFKGEAWPDARLVLYSQKLPSVHTLSPSAKGKHPVADEIDLIKIHGEGKLELVRSTGKAPFWIILGETTPQELVAELGPPDAIYRKNDQKMAIHKARSNSAHSRTESNDIRIQDESTDTDQSSAHTTTDDSENEDEEGEVAGKVSKEFFYNYFYHGFDVLLSTPTLPSQRPPSKGPSNDLSNGIIPMDSSSRLVASKFIIHGNVPGSYPFNRHRRCRWEINYLSQENINSETTFKDVEHYLFEEWKSIYPNFEEAKQRQRGMVLNRDWGDSPSSSCELLGGWEDSVGGKRADGAGLESEDIRGLGNTTLFGFPGLVFEVLKNDTVSCLTVF